MTTYYIIAGLILSAALLLRIKKRDHLQTCLLSINALAPGRLESIVEYVAFDGSDPAERGTAGLPFWQESGQLRGIAQRIVEVRHVLRILQASVALGFVNQNEAARVKVFAYRQILYSFLAIPEALRCKVFPAVKHSAALEAARFHWLATSLTITLCQVQGAPNDVLRYGALL